MIGEIICVGNELLIGDTLNTNTHYLSRQLTQLGVEVAYQSVVGDHEERLLEAIEQAKKRSDIVIFSGGLGPTYDDMTKETVAKSLNMPMVMDEESLTMIKSFFERLGRDMAESNLKQALRPEGGIALRNGNGTAPGVYVTKENVHYFLLPGPPRELKPMFINCVKPIIEDLSEVVIASKIFRLIGIGESDLVTKIGHIMDASTNPRVAPYAKIGSVHIRITASAKTTEEADAMVVAMSDKLTPYLEEYCYTTEEKELEEVVVDLIKDRGLTLSLAESCTGGLLSSRFVGVAGVSDVYQGGFVTYANEAKEKMLGVDKGLLIAHGAVSKEVACAMAKGVQNVMGTDIGVAITGVAGPGGGSKEKPVGTVHVAVAYGEHVFEKKLSLTGLRQKIRDYSAQYALILLYKILNKTID